MPLLLRFARQHAAEVRSFNYTTCRKRLAGLGDQAPAGAVNPRGEPARILGLTRLGSAESSGLTRWSSYQSIFNYKGKVFG